MSDVIIAAQQALHHHGRTFALASHLLPPDSRNDAAILYALCRLCDDLADEAPDPIQARVHLAALLDHLRGLAAGHTLSYHLLDHTLDVPGSGALVRACLLYTSPSPRD